MLPKFEGSDLFEKSDKFVSGDDKTFIVKFAHPHRLSCSTFSVLRIWVTLYFPPMNKSYLDKGLLNNYLPPFSPMSI